MDGDVGISLDNIAIAAVNTGYEPMNNNTGSTETEDKGTNLV